jgi:hypothetical protein
MRRRWLIAVGMCAAMVLPASAGAATDYAATALNIIPSGQYGGVPVHPGADTQAKMYDGLTPLFDDVRKADLFTYFKSEGLGVGPDGPTTAEPVPRPGVRIVRDKYNVPHVTGATHDDGVWAAARIAACCSSRPATTPTSPRSTPPASTRST